MAFQWWYPILAVLLFIVLFGRRKGGVVARRLTADLKILDPRFEGCRPQADYCTFRNEGPAHIEIEVEGLRVPVGETLRFELNGSLLADVPVERDREAEFDHWEGDGVEFPEVRAGDELTIRYEGEVVLRGVFA